MLGMHGLVGLMMSKSSTNDASQSKAISHIKTTGAICVGIGILVPLVSVLRADEVWHLGIGVAIAIWFLWLGITLYKLPSAAKAKTCLILALISSIVLATGIIPLLSLISSIAALINLKHYRAWKEGGSAARVSSLDVHTAFTTVNRYGLMLTNKIDDGGKLSNLEGVQAIFMSLALMYILADRQAHISLSPSQRKDFSDELLARILNYLVDKVGTKKEPSLKLLTTNIRMLGRYASKLTPDSGDKGFAGTLFWEFGRIAEKRLPESGLSQVELSMMAMEVSGDLLDTLRSSTGGSKKPSHSSRGRTVLKTIAIAGVAIIAFAWLVDVSESSSRCEEEAAHLKGVVERSEQYLKETEERAEYSEVAVEYYNKHIPEHNQYVANYNAKIAECK